MISKLLILIHLKVLKYNSKRNVFCIYFYIYFEGLDVDSFNCVKIDYFPKEGYQPDPHDSTAAIPCTFTENV